MLLSEYLNIGNKLDAHGVFDPILDVDSSFFINLQRLKKSTVKEFQNSYKRIQDYFRKIILLLDKAEKKDKSDTFYKQALKLFDFSEVNGLCLGYAKGTIGSGFGNTLAVQVIGTAYDIVKAGIKEPEFFELLPLFQEKVGPDRLSDMVATLILTDIEAYTQRIIAEMEITKQNYKDYNFSGKWLMNPYKQDKILLVPTEILHKLPIAECWEDIDLVVSQNNTIRAEINSEVAHEWHKYTLAKQKYYIKKTVFENVDVCKRVLNGYRQEELEEFYPCENFQYFLTKLEQSFKNIKLDYKKVTKEINSYEGALDILKVFQQWVENNKGWAVILDASSQNREKIVQRIIHLSGLSYIKANNLDMSCEPNPGAGPVDFKVSRGQDITLIEIKLTSNSKYLHGYEKQIQQYGKSEQTERLIYGLIDLGHPNKVKKIQSLHDRKMDEGQKIPTLIIIDSTQKESPSKA